jgi:hypothetical protein
MSIISWDVGIKNLAYCILEKSNDIERPYIIHEWDIINLAEDADVQCCYRGCDKKSGDIKTMCCLMGDNMFFCKSHRTYHSVIKGRLDDVKAGTEDATGHGCSKCGKPCKWKMNGSFLCTLHKNQYVKKWDKEVEEVKFSPGKVADLGVDELKLKLLRVLDSRPSLLKVRRVCIENQPTFKNPRMKAVSDTLYAWFLIRGILDKEKTGSLIEKVHFISPSNKLKIEGFTDEIQNEIIESNNKYKTTKALSVQHTRIILKHCPEYLTILERFKKKDDLCDALLQGVHFLENKYHN